LPPSPVPQPLPAWYLDALPKITGPVYMYSGQRLNQTDQQKEALRKALEKLQKEQGVQRTYNRNFLWADSVGDREPPKPTREMIPTLKPDLDLVPWDIKRPIIENKDETRSTFRMLQPSGYRINEFSEPWDEEGVRASRKPVERDTNPPPNATKHPRRWNPNPSPSGFLDEDPHARFKSIFGGQTEEEMAAEQAQRVEGTINTWTEKLVVDDPVMRLDLRSRDQVPQQERLNSMLKDAPIKRSYKTLYKGKKPLALSTEPSAFMVTLNGRTVEPREEEKHTSASMQLTWRGSSTWRPPPPQ